LTVQPGEWASIGWPLVQSSSYKTKHGVLKRLPTIRKATRDTIHNKHLQVSQTQQFKASNKDNTSLIPRPPDKPGTRLRQHNQEANL